MGMATFTDNKEQIHREFSQLENLYVKLKDDYDFNLPEKLRFGKYEFINTNKYRLVELGIDSYAGILYTTSYQIEFDYGVWSYEFNNELPPEYEVSEEIVEGHLIKTVKAINPHEGLTGMNILYYQDCLNTTSDCNSLTMYARDLTFTQQQEVLEFFNSWTYN